MPLDLGRHKGEQGRLNEAEDPCSSQTWRLLMWPKQPRQLKRLPEVATRAVVSVQSLGPCMGCESVVSSEAEI